MYHRHISELHLRRRWLHARNDMSRQHITEAPLEPENPFCVPRSFKNHPELERRGIQLLEFLSPVGVPSLPAYPALMYYFFLSRAIYTYPTKLLHDGLLRFLDRAGTSWLCTDGFSVILRPCGLTHLDRYLWDMYCIGIFFK